MKLTISLFLSLFMSVSFAGTPVETMIPVEDIFSPVGFDSNDSTEVIVSGWLPNLCHKTPKTNFEVKGKTINITVTALKYDATNPFCPEFTPPRGVTIPSVMVVPFVKAVDVGVLDKGEYKIVVNGKTRFEKESKIKIDESSSNALDDHIYANVHFIEQEMGNDTITLKGYNPSDCYELDEVKFISNGVNTYSILPIMKKVREFCPMKLVPFSYEEKVPELLNHSKILLHVRSMEGNSVNSLFIK